ncbi:hypothetical protein ACFYP6_38390 [Streptomyces goshikiensis]|uniref:hypothetical protein n=1 Tax=Streptomyces goshikiensis TaxID=1942 RepID=UPI0036B85B74
MSLLLIVLILLVTTGYLGFFGVLDVSTALAYTGRFTGVLLIVAAAVVLLGAIAAVDHWYRQSFPNSGLVALLGSVTAATANLMLFITALREGDSTAYLLVWCALAAGGAWAAVAVYRTSVEIPAPKRVAAAVIVSGAVAVANFGYTQLYQPYHTEINPVLDVTLGEPVLSADKKAFALPVTISFENRSDVGVYLLAPEFRVLGTAVAVSPERRPPSQWQRDVESGRPVSLWEIRGQPELLQAGSWHVFGSWLAGHQTYVTSRTVVLPRSTPYDQIQVAASTAIARRDRMSMDEFGIPHVSWKGNPVKAPDWVLAGASGYVTYEGRIHENNAIAEHTRDPRHLTVWWTFGGHGAGVSGTIARTGEGDRQLTGAEMVALKNRYGFDFVNKGWVTRSLWDVKS